MYGILKRLQCAYSFSKSIIEVVNVEGVWDSRKTLPTDVHVQTLRIITLQHTIERAPLSTTWDVLDNCAG